MARDVEIEWNDEATGRFLNGPEINRVLVEAAEGVAASARNIAPFRTGAYQASIRVELDASGKRARSKVTANVPYAAAVEARRGTLARAVNFHRH